MYSPLTTRLKYHKSDGMDTKHLGFREFLTTQKTHEKILVFWLRNIICCHQFLPAFNAFLL